MSRSTTLFFLTSVLIGYFVPTQVVCADKPSQARQSFRVHVPGGIRIVATNREANGAAQAVRISAEMDVFVAIQHSSGLSTSPSSVCLIREGNTVTIPITQHIDSDNSNALPLLTILPGW